MSVDVSTFVQPVLQAFRGDALCVTASHTCAGDWIHFTGDPATFRPMISELLALGFPQNGGAMTMGTDSLGRFGTNLIKPGFSIRSDADEVLFNAIWQELAAAGVALGARSH